MSVSSYILYKKDATESELIAFKDECLARMRELRGSKVSAFDGSTHRLRSEYEQLESYVKQANRKMGKWVEYDYHSDKDEEPSDRYGHYSPRVTYTLGLCIIKGLRDVIPERYSNDGAYGFDEWLNALGVVTSKTVSDHESGGLFYYFSSETACKKFIDRINAKMTELHNKGLI